MVEKIKQADLTGKGVVGLADTPGLDTLAMQNKFDEIALAVIVPKVNELIDHLTTENIDNAVISSTIKNIQTDLDYYFQISLDGLNYVDVKTKATNSYGSLGDGTSKTVQQMLNQLYDMINNGFNNLYASEVKLDGSATGGTVSGALTELTNGLAQLRSDMNAEFSDLYANEIKYDNTQSGTTGTVQGALSDIYTQLTEHKANEYIHIPSPQAIIDNNNHILTGSLNGTMDWTQFIVGLIALSQTPNRFTVATEKAVVDAINSLKETIYSAYGVSIPVLDGSGKLPINYIPATAISETIKITNENQLTTLDAQKNDIACLIDANTENGEQTIVKSWQLLDTDPTIRDNWILCGTSFSVKSGFAESSNTSQLSNNSLKLNGKTYTAYPQSQYDTATIPDNEISFIYPDEVV